MPVGSLAVSHRRYRLPLRTPFVTARGTIEAREGYLVRVEDADGLAGYGEAAPLPDHGGENLADAGRALDALSAWLAREAHEFDAVAPGTPSTSGRPGTSGTPGTPGTPGTSGTPGTPGTSGSPGTPDTPRTPGAPGTLQHLARLTDAMALLEPAAPAARSGLSLALADLFARRAQMPLARWLSEDARAEVAVNGTIGAVGPDEARSRATELVAEGYRTIKIKLDRDVAGSVARVAAVREAVADAGADASPVAAGSDLTTIALRGDANGAWDPQTAVAALERLAEFDLEYVEQPVPADDVSGLARVRRAASVPVAADEALLMPGGADRVLALDAADVYVLKPSLMGGPLAAWSAAGRAREAGAGVVVTSALEGSVGRAGALHVAAALPGCDLACGLATGGMLAEDIAESDSPVRGSIRLSERPGLGIEIDRDWKPGLG